MEKPLPLEIKIVEESHAPSVAHRTDSAGELPAAARVARIAPVSREMIHNCVSHCTLGPAEVVLTVHVRLLNPPGAGRRPGIHCPSART